ncbi:MAG TPA: hypothetical protein VEZ15_13615 [Acidimicrobiia bacterium]|nr:hypothetical protein [Acidimicrobiia bacterium]
MNRPSRAGLALGLAAGVPVMLIGIIGLVQHMDASPPPSFLKFFVGSDVVHDAVVAPIAGVVGFLVVRRLPAAVRGPVRGALFGSAVLIAVTWPALRGYGRMRAPDNKTVQPLNYATAVATAVAMVWAVCALWLALVLIRERRRRVAELRR